MRGSLKLFTWFGIPVHLHWSFGLILLFPLWEGYSNNLGVGLTLALVGAYLAMFLCILLHEYGHALTARHYGVHTQDITLLPIGGLARLDRMLEKPVQEFFVAIAGPMVNVVIALGLFGLGMLVFEGDHLILFKWIIRQNLFLDDQGTPPVEMEDLQQMKSWLLLILPSLVAANIFLVVFNLIPAFPMDGGRIFRALLSFRLERARATQIAARLGQLIAIVFIFIGVSGLWKGSIVLSAIGVFVFLAAQAENVMVGRDALLRRFKARDLTRPQFTRLNKNDWMQTPIALLQHGLERHFLVFDMDGQLSGVLEEAAIIEALKKRDLSAEISQYARPMVKMVPADQDLQYVFQLLMQRGNGMVAVTDDEALIGVIDQAGIQHFMRLQAM